MLPEKLGRAVGAFFSGVGTFIGSGIVLEIVLQVFSPRYGAQTFYWRELVISLLTMSIGASLAAFVATTKFRGLGFTWGMIFGTFAGGVAFLSTFVGFGSSNMEWARVFGIIPLLAPIAAGIWAERLIEASPQTAPSSPAPEGGGVEERLGRVEAGLAAVESLPERVRQLEARLSGLSEAPAPVAAKAEMAAPVRPKPMLPAPPPRIPPQPKPEFSWDDLLEGRWLFRVGMAIFLLGVSFFLKYAFENRWIGPTGRVIMGFVAGVFFITLGDRQQKKGLAVYGQTMIGGGLGILYLSIFAAFHFYGLLDQFPAFCAMALVTATAAVFALRYSAVSIIAVAMAGGFATPALLSTGVVKEVPLFSYLALLDVGILAVSAFRNWRAINLLALLLTQIWLQSYFGLDYKPESLGVMFAFTTAFFVLFLIPSWRFNIQGRIASEAPDLVLLVANAALYYLGCYYHLLEHSPWERWEAHLAVAVGFVYFLLAWRTFERGQDDKRLLLCEMGLAASFAVIAIPIAWKWEWVTIGWAVEGLVLLWIGLRLKDAPFRWAARGLLLAAGFRAAAFDLDLRTAYEPLFNTRSLSFLAVLLVMALALKLLGDREADLSAEEKSVSGAIPVVWNVLMLIWLCAEAADYLKNVYIPNHPTASLTHYTTVSYSVISTLYASVLMAIGLLKAMRGVRLGAELLFGLTALKVLLFDLSELPLGPRVVSFLVLGGLILFVSYFMQKQQRDKAAA